MHREPVYKFPMCPRARRKDIARTKRRRSLAGGLPGYVYPERGSVNAEVFWMWPIYNFSPYFENLFLFIKHGLKFPKDVDAFHNNLDKFGTDGEPHFRREKLLFSYETFRQGSVFSEAASFLVPRSIS